MGDLPRGSSLQFHTYQFTPFPRLPVPTGNTRFTHMPHKAQPPPLQAIAMTLSPSPLPSTRCTNTCARVPGSLACLDSLPAPPSLTPRANSRVFSHPHQIQLSSSVLPNTSQAPFPRPVLIYRSGHSASTSSSRRSVPTRTSGT